MTWISTASCQALHKLYKIILHNITHKPKLYSSHPIKQDLLNLLMLVKSTLVVYVVLTYLNFLWSCRWKSGLESFGRILISSNGKTKRIAFFLLFSGKKHIFKILQMLNFFLAIFVNVFRFSYFLKFSIFLYVFFYSCFFLLLLWFFVHFWFFF